MISFLRNAVIFTLLFTSTSLFAQFQFKVGYSFGFTNPEVSNGIIERYNAEKSFFTDPLEEYNSLSGFALGVRWHSDVAAVELAWDNKYNRQYAEGVEPVSNDDQFREIFLRFGSYSLALESFIGPVGIGGSIDLNRASIRTRHTDQRDKKKILGESGVSSNFFLSYNFEASDFTSFSLKPYIQIPWRGVDLFELEQELNPEYAATADPSAYKEKFLNFGIQVIFYNGN